MPSNGCTMPNWTWSHYFLLIWGEHVRSRDLEGVRWTVVVDVDFFMVRHPDFLKKDHSRNVGLEKRCQIVSVSLVTLNVKQEKF